MEWNGVVISLKNRALGLERICEGVVGALTSEVSATSITPVAGNGPVGKTKAGRERNYKALARHAWKT
jgi:hypothetical protein